MRCDINTLPPHLEKVTKLFLLQFVLFVRYFVKLAQNDFRRSRAMPQSFCWLSSSRTKRDRKSTRLNSSHSSISYAVFFLNKINNIYAHSFKQKYYNLIMNYITYHTYH